MAGCRVGRGGQELGVSNCLGGRVVGLGGSDLVLLLAPEHSV